MTVHHCHDCGHDFADDLTVTTAADATPAEDDDQPPDDWAPIDLAPIAEAIRRGDIARTLPTVLQVADHLPWFYRARINQLFGESGGGKSWVGMQAVAETVVAVSGRWWSTGRTTRTASPRTPRAARRRPGRHRPADYRNPSGAIPPAWNGSTKAPTGSPRRPPPAKRYALRRQPNDDGEVAQWFAIVKRMTRLPGGPRRHHRPRAQRQGSPQRLRHRLAAQGAAVTGASYRVDTLKEPTWPRREASSPSPRIGWAIGRRDPSPPRSTCTPPRTVRCASNWRSAKAGGHGAWREVPGRRTSCERVSRYRRRAGGVAAGRLQVGQRQDGRLRLAPRMPCRGGGS